MTFPVLTIEDMRRRIAKLPRVPLAHLPTPLEEIPRFAKAIGAGRVFIKRDDCTGLLFGGNKTRHNEFLLADALEKRADMFVWGAGVQSNNCRQTAAACAKLGLDCQLYLSRAAHNDDIQGNLLLDYLVGAKVQVVDDNIGPELDALMLAKAEEFRAAGRRPYVWDRDHVRPIAAVSYALCLAEILEQMPKGLTPSVIYVSSAGSTGSGMALGKAFLSIPAKVRSICPIKWPWDCHADMAKIANQAAELLDLPHRLAAADIDATEDYVGPAYGAVSPGGREAMDLLGKTEGILLDPVYTAKAMAALIDDVRKKRVSRDAVLVFVHTGGLPAVFAYRDELLASKA